MLLVQYKDVWHGKHLDKYLPNKYANIFMKLTIKKVLKTWRNLKMKKIEILKIQIIILDTRDVSIERVERQM